MLSTENRFPVSAAGSEMILVDIDQLSDDWFEARGAIPTASGFDRIVTSRGEPSKQQKAYLYQLAGESILGRKEEGYTNYAMQRGIELEPEARGYYELVKGVEVQQVGLCYPDKKMKYACSPDGLVGDDGMIEIKCPVIHTHVEYLLNNKIPTAYIQQVQGSLLITGRDWCDFMSYYPGLRALIVRVERDEKFIKKLSNELDSFCDRLSILIEKLRGL
jgi:putative phage-type endonuclease